MNSVNKFLCILLIVGIAIGGCDLLEPDEANIYTKERAYEDPLFAEGVLLMAYVNIPTRYSDVPVTTDDAVSNNKSSSYLRMATGQWSAVYDPMSIWSSSYTSIFNVNYFLSLADDVSFSWESATRDKLFRSRLKGEAYALRAFHHMRLLMYYGGIAKDGNLLGIPIVKEVLDPESGNWKVGRSTYQDCVNEIMDDFNSASALLPYEYHDVAGDNDSTRVFGAWLKNRVQRKIIKALQARLALHVASPAYNNGTYNTSKCVEAATLAGQMLTEIGGTTGLDAGGHLFYDADGDINRPEILWRNNTYTDNAKERQCFPPSLFGNGDINPTQNLVDAFPMANGYPISATESGFDPANPYSGRDPRLAAYILYNGNKLGSATIQTDVNSDQDGLNKLTTSTRTGYYLKKLLRHDVNLNPTVNSTKIHSYCHIRYTELFLIYAEAANQAWGPDSDPNSYGFTARSVIQAIRKRAGISGNDPYLASRMSKEEMAELIQNERRLELCFEGFRFSDLRRWKLPLTETAKGVRIDETAFTPIDVEARNYKAHMYYGPIPLTEVLKNNAILQNQGW